MSHGLDLSCWRLADRYLGPSWPVHGIATDWSLNHTEARDLRIISHQFWCVTIIINLKLTTRDHLIATLHRVGGVIVRAFHWV
jgi:hypothetical protein